MAVLVLKMTDAGLAAVQAASGTDPVSITELGLTATPFDYAPTLEALPGEFKRLDVAGGVAAAANVTHLTAYDTSGDAWTATGLGLFLEDGTLFAVHASADPIMSKVPLAFGLLAFDIAFEADLAANIEYGNAIFAYPPATGEIPGVAKIAAQARVDAAEDGEDDAQTIVTPKTLRARLAAMLADITASIAGVINTVNAEVIARAAAITTLGAAIDSEATVRANADAALAAHTVNAGGLVSGGGALSTNPTLTVNECSEGDFAAGTAADKVVTPRRLGPIAYLFASNGYIRFFGLQLAWGRFFASPNTNTTITFALAFNNACCAAVANGSGTGADSQDNWPATDASTLTAANFQVFSASDGSVECTYIAVGY